MIIQFHITIIIISILIACSSKNDQSEKPLKDPEPEIESLSIDTLKEERPIIYGHISEFYPEIHKDEKLKKIDKPFFDKVIRQIAENMYYTKDDDPEVHNFFISRQHPVQGYEALTVSLYWSLCYEGVHLLLLDKGSNLVNHFPLTEWYSSCDSPGSTTTKFINDTTFIQEVNWAEPGEKMYVTEVKWKGKFNKSGKVDTIEVISKKEYEE